MFLTFTALSNQTCTERSDTILSCKTDGNITWSKGVGGQRVVILSAQPDPDQRISVFNESSLMIKNLSVSDSGVYSCNSVPVVNLIVTRIKGGLNTGVCLNE